MPQPLVILQEPQSDERLAANNLLNGKKAVYYTLGCKLNFSETSTLAGELETLGVTTATPSERADICIINTCTVTSVADRKARSLIRQAIRSHPSAVVLVTGCYAQLAGQEIASIPGVSLVVGAGRKQEIVGHLQNLFDPTSQKETASTPVYLADRSHMHIFEEGCSRDDRTRHFLKVQDGCNYACSYCTIPKARGRSRNGSIASLVAQAEKVASEGGQEIVLTGVNIGDFGRTTGENLVSLVQALDKVSGIERYRISSLEPDLISDELIDVVASSKRFMPHWHIPLQSGSDSVLRLMRRQYDSKLFAQRVEKILHVMPDAFIGVDIIAGMRGETDDLFAESLAFLRDTPFTRLHIFPYSERAGTAALKIFPIVTPAMKKIRTQALKKLSDERIATFFARFKESVRPVLWERSDQEGYIAGFTDNYIRLYTPYDARLAEKIVPARVGNQQPGEEYCFAEEVFL